jgi:hypothetical protein
MALFRAACGLVATESKTLRSSLLDSTLACGIFVAPKHHVSTRAAYFLMFWLDDRKDGSRHANYLNGLTLNLRFHAFSYVFAGQRPPEQSVV